MFNQTLEDGLPLYFNSRRSGPAHRDGCLARILFRNKALGEIPAGQTQRGCSPLLLPLSGNHWLNNHILGIAMFREDALGDSEDASTRPGEHATLLQATAEDLSRRVLDAAVA